MSKENKEKSEETCQEIESEMRSKVGCGDSEVYCDDYDFLNS
jgi:hypothetical protein